MPEKDKLFFLVVIAHEAVYYVFARYGAHYFFISRDGKPPEGVLYEELRNVFKRVVFLHRADRLCHDVFGRKLHKIIRFHRPYDILFGNNAYEGTPRIYDGYIAYLFFREDLADMLYGFMDLSGNDFLFHNVPYVRHEITSFLFCRKICALC